MNNANHTFMLKNTILGSYMPAFFRMEINFPFPDGKLCKNISEKDSSVFIHEYIHFLQDITTFTGLNNAYVFSEIMHSAVNYIYANNKGPIEIPLEYEKYDSVNLKANIFLQTHTRGSLCDINTLFIKRIIINSVSVPTNSIGLTKITNVKIERVGGEPIIFGSRAIMESMAYLVEKKITRGSVSAPEYPYHAAELIADHLYPDFGNDPLKIIALCDVSLQFSEPGKIFVQLLQEFKKSNFLPNAPYEIIDYLSTKNISKGLNTVTSFRNAFNEIGKVTKERLKLYMNAPQFSPFQEVIDTLIDFGLSKRLNNYYYMLGIANGGYYSENQLMLEAMESIGTPIIFDSNNNTWIIYPRDHSPQNYWIEYFSAIEELYNCLIEGHDCCNLFPWCEKSPDTDVDERCFFEPWSHVEDAKLCPFALLWKHWNLIGYLPTRRPTISNSNH